MVQPLPASQCLHHSFTALPTSVTSSRVQQLVQEPHSRVDAGVGVTGGRKPWPSRTSNFCFSSDCNARSTLRRDKPVASITALIVVAPLSTARATFDVT